MKTLRALLTLTLLLTGLPLPPASAADDNLAPTCAIRAVYSQHGPNGTEKFTFIVDASDNVAVKRLQYRAAVSGGDLGAFRNYPYVSGTRITFTVACNKFTIQFRAVDSSGNQSAVVEKSFTAPFPEKRIPTPEPLFIKKSTPGVPATGEVKDVATADVNGDGFGDVAVADYDAKTVRLRLGNSSGLGAALPELIFSEGPQDISFGRIFGPNGSSANDPRPDIVVAVGTKVRVLINNGAAGDNVAFSSSDTVPFLLPESTFFYCVAVRDVNGDGYDDIIAGGVYGFPTVGTVDIYLNKGAVADGMGGFRHGGFEAPVEVRTGLRIEHILLADIDEDGTSDIVAADTENKKIITMLNNGNGTFAAPVEQNTIVKPEAITVGDVTNDGYVDIACFGSYFAGTATQAGFQLLRNSADPADNYGTFVSAGFFPTIVIPLADPNVFVPGDIAINDVTLDGIPEILICNNPGNSVDIYRFAVIRDQDGNFAALVKEGVQQLKNLPGPMKFAVGRINGDSKPDIAVGNYSTDQLTVFLNNKGTSGKSSPFSVKTTLTPQSDPTSGVTIVEDIVDGEVSYSNDGFDDETGVTLSVTLPNSVDVFFTDADSDGVDDIYGFTREIKSNGSTLLSWALGDLLISQGGKRNFRFRVQIDVRIKSRIAATALLKNARYKKTARDSVIVSTTVSVAVSSPQMTVYPGGLAEFKLTVKNHAQFAALGVKVTVPVPANCGLRTAGGAAPQFIDSNNDVIFRINPTTGKKVVPPKLAPFSHLDEDGNPVVTNPAWPGDRRSVSWYIGTMTPGEQVVMRFYAKLAYDFDPANPASLTLGELVGRQTVAGRATGDIGEIIQLGDSPLLQIAAPSAPVAQPSLILFQSQQASGAPEGASFVTVTNSSRAIIPGVEPTLRTNQIRYQLLYGNLGREPAESLRLFVLVPAGTFIADKRGVFIDGVEVPASRVTIQRLNRNTVPLAPEFKDTFQEGDFLSVDVPYLEANFPFNPQSFHTVTFTVTLRSAVSVGTSLSSLAYIQSDELLKTTFSGPRVSVAQVVKPVQIEKRAASRDPAVTKQSGDTFTTAAIYQNTGGIAATGVEVILDQGPGSTFQSAFLFDANQTRTPISPEALGNGQYRYVHGTLGTGEAGILRIGAVFAANFATVNTNRTDPLRGNSEPSFRLTDAAERATAAAPSSLVRAFSAPSLAEALRTATFPTRQAPAATAPRFMLFQKAPRLVPPNGLITYTLCWANLSDVWGPQPGAASVRFVLPKNTTFVSATNTVSLSNTTFGDTNDNFPVRFGNEVNWQTQNFSATNIKVATPQPHQAVIATVTVQVNAGATAGVIISDGFHIDSFDAGDFYAWPVKTVIADAKLAPEQLRNDLLSAMVGSSREVAEKNALFQNDLNAWLAAAGPVMGIGGAGVLELSAGPRIIPIGGGNIVAAGGGNIVAAGGGNIVAAGGGNIVAAGGGNIVAAGGGNVVANDGAGIVAAGGGNLIAVQAVVADLSQANLYNLVATVKFNADQAMHPDITPTLLPGASIVAAGGGNIVSGGGGNLIAPDGSGIINNDNGSLIDANAVLQSAPVNVLGGPVLNFSIKEGAPMTEQVGPGVITVNADGQAFIGSAYLIGHDGSSLIGHDGSSLLGNDGASLLGNDGASLIGNDGATFIGAGASNIFPAGGTPVINHNGN